MKSDAIFCLKAIVSLGLAGCILLFLLAVVGSRTAEAQVSGATLSGTVTDPSGALVPNASIQIRNADTGATRNVNSNADGFYSAPNLNPGNYEVKISSKGFSTTLQKGIVLTVSSQQTLVHDDGRPGRPDGGRPDCAAFGPGDLFHTQCNR